MTDERPLFELPDGCETRWLTPENPDGARGAAGKTNFGRKGAACRGALKAGETWVIGEGEGNGTIRRMWITISSMDPEYLRGIVLRMYWDGATKPAVEVPLGDFFCNPLGRRHAYANAWFNSPENKNWNSTVPMPFRKAFRVTVTNESPRDCGMFWYHIDVTMGDRHGDHTGYFHAYWNRENPTVLRRDFRILPRVEGRGRYLGCSMGLITRPYYNAWWGEGEVKVYLDGDTELPTLCGTGTEDYICSAWGIGTFSLPWYGCHFLKVADPDRMQISMYRLHGPDPVWFSRDIRVELQQIGFWEGEKSVRQVQATGQKEVVFAGDGKAVVPVDELEGRPLPTSLFEREDDWCATAYFYLDRPESGLPAIAPYSERVADLTGEPGSLDELCVTLEKALWWLPPAEDLRARMPRLATAESAAKILAAMVSRQEELTKACRSAAKELASNPASPKADRLRELLKRVKDLGLAGVAYAKMLDRTVKALPKDPSYPLVVRKFKASPLQPPVVNISTARQPRAGLARQVVPFVSEHELADVRSVHGGADGVVYIEASVTLDRAYQGALVYGVDGPVKVWVNSRAVDCRPQATNPARIGEYVTPVSWKKGANRIVFALGTNHGRAWGVQARVMRL